MEFLTATRSDWTGVFEGHINWHLILYYLGGSLFSTLRHPLVTTGCFIVDSSPFVAMRFQRESYNECHVQEISHGVVTKWKQLRVFSGDRHEFTTKFSFVCLYLPPDLGDIDKVLAEFDTHLKPRAKKDNLFGLLDASSLLWRLEAMGIDAGEERWSVVTEGMTPHAHNHRSPW